LIERIVDLEQRRLCFTTSQSKPTIIMKSLAATGLLLCASLLAPVSARHGSSDRTASVHLLGPRSSSSSHHSGSHRGSTVNSAASSSSSSIYSPSDANALISSFLRIEEYEVLRDGLEVPQQLTMQPFEHEHGSNNEEPLMVLSEDLSSYGVNGFFPSLQEENGAMAERLVHSFKVESTPGPKAWVQLLETYRIRIAEKFGLTLKDGNDSSAKDKRMMMPPVPGSLGGDMALGPELVDQVSFPKASYHVFYRANSFGQVYVPYVKALQSLASLQDGEINTANVPIIQLKGLRDIAIKFGLESEELKKAQEMLSITAEVCVWEYYCPTEIVILTRPTFDPACRYRASSLRTLAKSC
jgi:hypothetical protein